MGEGETVFLMDAFFVDCGSAGMSPFYKSLADISEDYWEKVRWTERWFGISSAFLAITQTSGLFPHRSSAST